MNKVEALALAIARGNGAFDPGTKAFNLLNAGLLRSYRPEKQVDSECVRIFSTWAGGFKALVADIQAKVDGKNQSFSPESELGELLIRRGFKNEAGQRPIVLFLRKAIGDEEITVHTPLTYFQEVKGDVNGQ